MARSVISETSRFQPDVIGEFVDAFLPDHGRIHVGQEQALAAGAPGLDDDVDGLRRERRADSCLSAVVSPAPATTMSAAIPLPGSGSASLSQRVRGARASSARTARRRTGGRRGSRRGTRDGPSVRARELEGSTESARSSSQGRPPPASRPSASALAHSLGGVVINADSMQVYATCGSSRRGRLPPRRRTRRTGSTAMWTPRSTSPSGATWRRRPRWPNLRDGPLPIFVGGTGLYFKALTEGLSDIPPVPEAVREAVRRGERRHEDAGICTGSSRSAIPRRPRASPLGPAAGPARPGGLRGDRAGPWRRSTAPGSRGPWPAHPLAKLFLAPERDECASGSTPASVSMMEQGALDEVRALGAAGSTRCCRRCGRTAFPGCSLTCAGR